MNRLQGRGEYPDFAALAAVLLASCTALWGADATSFPSFQEIGLAPGAGTGTVASCALDENVLAATDEGYTGLRILDENDCETPFLIRRQRRVRTVVSEETVPTEKVSLKTLPGNCLEVLLRTRDGSGASADAAVIRTSQRNFEKQVSVEGTPAGGTWKALVQDCPIFDYTRFMDMRNLRVDFEPATCTQFRVRISNISEKQQSPLTQIERDTRGGAVFSEVEKASFLREDFRIEDIRLIARKTVETGAEAVTRAYTVLDLQVTADRDRKETTVTFRTRRAPVTSLSLRTSDVNFSRPATVEVSEDGRTWRAIASGTLSRIRIRSFRQDRLQIALGGAARHALYRISIRDGDCQPLKIEGVEAEGVVDEAIFFPDPARRYRLFYGASGMASPSYDVAAVLAGVGFAEGTPCSLGGPKDNPRYRPARAPADAAWTRRFFVGAVCVMVAALVGLIAWALRRVDKTGPASS